MAGTAGMRQLVLVCAVIINNNITGNNEKRQNATNFLAEGADALFILGEAGSSFPSSTCS